jgi:acetolactate synthase-1/2/3 large subunit
MEQLSDKISEPLPAKKEWFEICRGWKEKYPVVDSVRHYTKEDIVNPYAFMKELSSYVPENTMIVSGNGSACVVGCSAFELKKGQRFLLNSGAASMGYDLPGAIGACFGAGKGETICLTGDGSIQMNLQELQTIVFHNLPVKIVVINNAGYHSIRQTQNNLFRELPKVGIGPESGDLGFPDMEKIAGAYGIPYCAIKHPRETGNVLEQFFAIDGYAMCEVYVDTEQVFEPKPTAKRLEDGTLVSPPLEDMAPFLSKEELREIMQIPLVGEEERH